MEKYGIMRLRCRSIKRGTKVYQTYSMDLAKEEGIRLSKLGDQWEIEDVDPKGWVQLKRKVPTSMADFHVKPEDPKTTILLHCSRAEWSQFKSNLNDKGLTVCQSFTNYVQAVNESVDRLGEYPSIIIQNVWNGVPRSRSEKLIDRRVMVG
jgi:hypothetical protein